MTVPASGDANWQNFVAQTTPAQQAEAQRRVAQFAAFWKDPQPQNLPDNAALVDNSKHLCLTITVADSVVGRLMLPGIVQMGFEVGCDVQGRHGSHDLILQGQAVVIVYELDRLKTLPWVVDYLRSRQAKFEEQPRKSKRPWWR